MGIHRLLFSNLTRLVHGRAETAQGMVLMLILLMGLSIPEYIVDQSLRSKAQSPWLTLIVDC